MRSSAEVIAHWIDGRTDTGSDAAPLEIFNPAIGEPYAQMACGGANTVNRAVDAAWTSYHELWGQLSREERAARLNDVGQNLHNYSDELAEIESLDTGRPIRISRLVDGPAATSEMQFYAQALRADRGSFHDGDSDAIGLTLRQPFGVVGLIVPWNAPLLVLAEKLSQILAAGNCVVVKPSQHAPASAVALARLFSHCGLPPGVVNVVLGTGDEAGHLLASHPQVPRISFTGSTDVGRKILASAGDNLKEVTLELGGKNPVLVFRDADIDLAVANALFSAFYNSGQLCTSGSRILLDAEIADEFLDRFVPRAAALRVGTPNDDATQIGPLTTSAQYERVRAFVELGLAECEPLYVGTVPDGLSGWYEAPHIFKPPNNRHPLMQKEVFGPVTTIMTFHDEDEALDIANDTDYGLSSFLWTNDVRRINRLIRQINSGRVWVNTGHSIPPDMTLSGWNMSGLGAEGGLEGLRAFTRVKTVNMNLGVRSSPSFERLFPESEAL